MVRLTCGIFVFRPIGAKPEGKSMIFWRLGLNMPFISSADGLLLEARTGVSLLGREMMLASLVEPIKKREIISFA